MKKRKQNVKKTIKKKIDLKQGTDFFSTSKGVFREKKLNKNKTERLRQRLYGDDPKKKLNKNKTERLRQRLYDDDPKKKKTFYNKENTEKIKDVIQLENREPISIFITAYQTQDYIEECLDSIENQTYFEGFNNYEILVGVDGCQKTLNKLKKIRHKYRNLRIFMMESNKGTYITSNTLLDLVKYENILRFDSDDNMLPHMINEIMYYINNYDVILFRYHSFNNNGNILSNSKLFAGGVFYFNKNVINIAGGYKPWRCSADTEFYKRIMNHFKIKILENRLFYRRIHENSLTRKKETKIGSKIRKDYHKLIKVYPKIDNIYVKRIINQYKEI